LFMARLPFMSWQLDAADFSLAALPGALIATKRLTFEPEYSPSRSRSTAPKVSVVKSTITAGLAPFRAQPLRIGSGNPRDHMIAVKASAGCSGSAAKSPDAKHQTFFVMVSRQTATLFKCFRNVIKSGNAESEAVDWCVWGRKPESPSTPRREEILMQNAAPEANGSFDSLPNDPALETAGTSPENENGSEMRARVAAGVAVGIAASAFEAASIVLGTMAIWVPRHLPRNRAARIRFSGAPRSNSRAQRQTRERRALRPRRDPTAQWPADLER